MKSLVVYSLSLALLLGLAACSSEKIPGVYRIDIQQGNEVTQEMLDKLEPGMTKNQVAFLMGTPLVMSTFHPNRWDYVYSYQPGGGKREQRRITLFFNDEDQLNYIEGDTRTAERLQTEQATQEGRNVVVPLEEKKTGLFSGMLNLIGLGGDDTEIMPASDSEDEAAADETADATEDSDDVEADAAAQ